MAVFAWSLAAASNPASAASVHAESRPINIPAGALAKAIRRLSDSTGVSVGYAGRLPDIRTREVRGASNASEALRQMLQGSGYRAIATGLSSFRIERVPTTEPRPTPIPTAPSQSDVPQPEIVVTALKRPSPLSTLPATIRVIRDDRLFSATGIPGSDALARDIPALSISGLGPGRNRMFLRGIGDGPLNGFNQGSVAILLDESRLNYDAPDPDWALVDIDQVEVLEGPQGPLYGTGALGGIVKISTNRPDTSHASAQIFGGLSLTQDGDLSNSQSVAINVPLASGRLALRAVAYRQQQAGWIDNVGGRNDSNNERLSGGRATLRWTPGGWTIDLAAGAQSRGARDSQYVDGDLGPLERSDRLREPRDLDAKVAMLTVRGPLGGVDVTSITSISRQEAVAAYDATPLAALLGATGPTKVDDDRNYSLFDQEIRVSNPHSGRFDWLAGVSLIKATTDADIVAEDSADVFPILTFKRSVTEAALFGEASVALTPTLKLGGGARVFSSRVEDEGRQGGSDSLRGQRKVRGSGSASIAWNPTDHATFFVRAATAYRPGGINIQPDATQPSYDADELASAELGSRLELIPSLSVDATLFAAQWKHVQTDELLANGLVATRNAGNARNYGVEADIRWAISHRTELIGGLLLQSARLESSGSGEPIDDRRLPVVPQLSARLKLAQEFRLGSWEGKANLGLQYVGATHLSFDPALDRRTGGHAVIDASLGLTRGGWTVALVGDNLANSSADTFAFGNPYRVRTEPQRTPLKPRTVGITVGRSF
ncbi:TonB-dependent receptor [Sphingomonas sp. G124]|uniref:TonB-dependent receptor n=1 Tax=Sphingomonas cremea TaxID=2904799 RepID=A0A9X1QNM3_9SPHN|nr:TonB-dependent receptor [Sphingomonas cremea]MCF2515208.1 TonB-dependent receptor [Sphingomonas cremea]